MCKYSQRVCVSLTNYALCCSSLEDFDTNFASLSFHNLPLDQEGRILDANKLTITALESLHVRLVVSIYGMWIVSHL